MTLRRKIIILIGLVVLIGNSSLAMAESKPFSVIFINPGSADHGFWGNVTKSMRAAAADLKIDLEVLSSDRNRVKMVRQAYSASTRVNKPDYMILVNEVKQAPAMLEATEAAGIRTLLLLNDLTEVQKALHGRARAEYSNLLGSITPDNRVAGYEMAKSLIDAARTAGLAENGVTIMAFSGDKATPASLQRVVGLKEAVKEEV